MNYLGGKKSGGCFGAYEYTYTVKENEKDEVIIQAKMTINKNSKKAIKFIEKASKKNISPLSLILNEEVGGLIEINKEEVKCENEKLETK